VTRVSAQAVRHRAYNRFQARGSEHGHDAEDWLVAETELLKDNNIEIAPHPSLKLHSTVAEGARDGRRYPALNNQGHKTWHQ
jgi:Protein of unknown function (DUF2934)